MSNDAIKMKMAGTLSVINPSYRFVNFYGDRKLESFSSPNSTLSEEENILAYQDEVLEDKSLDANGMPNNKYLIYDVERDS